MNRMKEIRYLIMVFTISSIFLSHGVADATSDYLGEFCFSIDSRVVDVPDKILYLGVASLGDVHFPAHGKMTVVDRPGVIPVHGTVVKSGEDVVITLSGSDHGQGSDEIKFHAVIRQNPGNYTTIEHRVIHDPDAVEYDIEAFYDYGYITVIPCP